VLSVEGVGFRVQGSGFRVQGFDLDHLPRSIPALLQRRARI